MDNCIDTSAIVYVHLYTKLGSYSLYSVHAHRSHDHTVAISRSVLGTAVLMSIL